ncbi:MAG: glycosyltransferase family 2 protein [Desulfobacterota bacterium]|nr:glycosyltransferase family 2 protein [Thermodesulfobacteriota bacterium]
MKQKSIFISVVVPVYNEEQRIESFLGDVLTFFDASDFTHELIIVDDGSYDNTISLVKTFLKEHRNGDHRIVQLPKNQGKGEAIRQGMLAATGEYIFFIDADGSTSIHEVNSFIPQFDEMHEVYIGVRTKKHKAPLKRKFFGYGYIYLANFILSMNISDFTCGFKCYRRDAARRIFSLQTMKNWSFDAENLFIAKKNNFRIKEIPVYWKHCGGSKVKVFHNVITCGFDLLKIRWNNFCGVYR